MRVTPAQLDELLHPIIDPKAEAAKPLERAPAGPGANDELFLLPMML